MTTELAQKLEGVRDFKKILETVVKDLGETYSADMSQIVLSNPLDRNITSICEYKLYPEVVPDELPVAMSFPLPLQGSGLGVVTLARRQEFHENEINWIRITIAELCDIIRHAQINDVVQRDTFRSTFLSEIQNVMQYSLGLGDALFMVVNILGKVLQSSRCLFICVDDTQAGWKCFEFWQRERVRSSLDYGWPSTDSPIVARSLLTAQPLIVHEANQNSHMTPAQEELQLLGVRSLLGIPLKSENSTHGCIIVQHCDARHEWTRGEIDMVQNVADTVAEALSKLPQEKRAHEPIMRLHQREVVQQGEEKESILAVRRALRGALGNTVIPSAQKSGAPKAPSRPASVPVVSPTISPPAGSPAVTPLAVPMDVAPGALPAPGIEHSFVPPALSGTGQTALSGSAASDLESSIGDLADSLVSQAATDGNDIADDVSASLKDLLGGLRGGTPAPTGLDAWGNKKAETIDSTAAAPEARSPQPPSSPPAMVQPSAQPQPSSPAPSSAPPGGSRWGNLDSIPTPGATGGGPGTTPAGAPAGGTTQWGDLDAIQTPGARTAPTASTSAADFSSQFETIDKIPASDFTANLANAADSSAWGNLDAIPTPAAGSARGLGAALSKRAGNNAPASPLLASLHRDKSKFQPDKVKYVDGGTIQIDEAKAEAKLKQILSSSNPTSDYIFATAGVDARMLGRIDGWVTQVESKDKYEGPHAMQVAEYSVACGRLLGIPQKEIDSLRVAAIVHDIGKLGLPSNILQKPEDELSDTELLLIMKHPIDGANLLEGFPELAHLAPIVIAHHEEYDGNGYPAGLSGEQIPLHARIIHVASAYHSMVCPTKFRGAMSPAEAQQTLMAGAGKAYDPALVQVLIACVQQGMVIAGR